MANRLVKRYQITYYPGVPGFPALPGRWVPVSSLTAEQRARIGESSGSSQGLTVTIEGYPAYSAQQYGGQIFGYSVQQLVNGNIPPGGGMSGGQVWVPGTPAREAVPARISQSPQLGWNSGARSLPFFPQDGRIEFQIGPASVGVLLGIAETQDTLNFNEATHAFLYQNGVASIVERGQQKAVVSGVDFTQKPIFAIERTNGTVTYRVGSFTYTSAESSTGDAFMDALLYCADDYVDNPKVYRYQRMQATDAFMFDLGQNLAPRATDEFTFGGYGLMRSGDNVFGRADGRIQFVTQARGFSVNTCRATGDLALDGTVQAPAGNSIVYGINQRMISSEEDYARSLADWSGVGMVSYGGAPDVSTGSSIVFMAAAQVNSTGIGTAPAESTVVHTGYSVYSVDQDLFDDSWGRSTAYGIPVLVFSRDDRFSMEDYITTENLLLLDTWDITNAVNADIVSNLYLVDEIIGLVETEAGWTDVLVIRDIHGLLADLELAFTSGLYLTDGQMPDGRNPLQLGYNIDSKAVTTYENFGFLNIIDIGGQAYGVRSDGVYAITPGSDDGEPIYASLDMGALTFGTSNQKYLATAYAGVSTDGRVFFRITNDDGNVITYEAIGLGTNYRATLARGLSSSQWRVQLVVVDATELELDDIAFDVAVSARRIRRV